MIILCWTTGPIFLAPFFIGTNIGDNNIIGWREDQYLCTFTNPTGLWLTYMKICRVLFQFIPLIILPLAYLKMYRSIQENEKRMSFLSSKKTSFTPGKSGTSSSLNSRQPSIDQVKVPRKLSATIVSFIKRPSKTLKIKKTQDNEGDGSSALFRIALLIFIAFLILFLPSLIVNILPGRKCFDPRIHMLCSNITWINASLNPMIYSVFYPRFRKAYGKILRRGSSIFSTQSIFRVPRI